MSLELKLDPQLPPPSITVLGDSTIDNKIWVPSIFFNFIQDLLGFPRADSALRIKKYESNFFLKPQLSIVEQLMRLLPQYQIHDHANDGFNTTDVLQGAYRDKVFGQGTFKLFPHEKFLPLVAGAKDLEKSQQIILSIGGNNFREFLLDVWSIKNIKKRQEFIRNHFEPLFRRLNVDYLEILKRIRALNPEAQLIVMTQYYPCINQNTYQVYPFMLELGHALGLGKNPDNPLDVIHEIMKKTYSQILKNCAQEKLVIADITSSLNPFERRNFVSQIEPSGLGGKKIAQMLAYVIEKGRAGFAYRFLPAFFTSEGKDSSQIVAASFNQWQPLHPEQFQKK